MSGTVSVGMVAVIRPDAIGFWQVGMVPGQHRPASWSMEIEVIVLLKFYIHGESPHIR
ncbi:MAG: hypothetical protein AAGF93_14315 [Cyanobacteria bacterium P01_H01_bin.105]